MKYEDIKPKQIVKVNGIGYFYENLLQEINTCGEVFFKLNKNDKYPISVLIQHKTARLAYNFKCKDLTLIQ
jgi:hypothetical protein